jgi:diguanylate cyclase (GGDEF)-like protein
MPGSPLERIMQSDRLPTIPAVAVRVIDLVQRPDVSLDELGSMIERDPALAARVLRTANSGFYGRPRSISRVRDAILVLGLRTVKTLALGFTLVSDLRAREGAGLDHTWLWQRSLYAAIVARGVAGRAGLRIADEAFLGGLFHLLGVIALEGALGDDYRAVAAEAGHDTALLRARETDRFGVDHAWVGAALAERWNLPAGLVDAIRYAAEPDRSPLETAQLVLCVHAGTAGADVILGQRPGEQLTALRTACERLGLGSAAAEELVAAALADGATLAATFDIPASLLEPEEVLARANEALLRLTIESERENAALQAEREQLIQQASTDVLTGVANRRHFHEFLEEHFRLAARYGTPLSLFLVDLDHFKQLNDTYGHLVGDEVLRGVAQRMRGALRDADLLARFGGEEFVVVLPSTPLEGAVQSAERVREALAARPIEVAGQAIPVTASFGVSAYRADALMTPEWLIKEADLALYEAKRAGRNCVRAAGDEALFRI